MPTAVRSCRGSSTATPICRLRAGAPVSTSRRWAACATRRSPAPGVGSRPRPGRFVRAPTSRCWCNHAGWRPRCWRPGQRRLSASPATACPASRNCVRCDSPRRWRPRLPRPQPLLRCWRTRSPAATWPTRGWTRSSGCSRRGWRREALVRWTSSSSRSRSPTLTWSGWAHWRLGRDWRCAATSSSSAATARCRSPWRPEPAPSIISRRFTPTVSRRRCRLGPGPWAAGPPSGDPPATLAPDDVEPLAQADCAAVLLPAAEFLAAEHRAPGRELLDAGAIVVLGTDANPGTAPVVSMPLVIGLAVRLYGMTTREALAAATLNAAWTLGMQTERGSIEVGKQADLVLLDAPAEHVAYRLGHNPVQMAFIAGEPVYVRDERAAARLSRR